jgi:hypothetical protein
MNKVSRLFANWQPRSTLIPFHTQTPVDEVPMALAAFQGHLVAGIGKALRLYELGKKQLLRKCENNVSLGENDYGIRALI